MKQVIIVRKDLKMSLGKLASQSAHASVSAVLKSNSLIINKWKNQGMKKSVLKVSSLRELKKYQTKAKKLGLVNSLIKDSGRTFFKKSTITCLAIGPDKEGKIDPITKNLKLL